MGLTFTTLLLFKMFTGVAMVTTALVYTTIFVGGGVIILVVRGSSQQDQSGEYSNYISDRNQTSNTL